MLLMAILASVLSVTAQDKAPSMRELMAARALLTSDESVRLANGETVVKILPSQDKREISVIGIVKVPSAQSTDLAGFRESLSQRGNADAMDGGKFSVPPVLGDLERLKPDERDLADMQRCVVGKCSVKLSAEMITALKGVDWNAPDARKQAAEVYKRLLVEHAKAYLAKGDAGLPDYVDHKQNVRPSVENRSVLDASFLMKALAPDLDDYLRRYPNAAVPGIESRLDWTNVSSGLKPILTITHTASYAKETRDSSILMIATKQVYASHYVDASLAVSSLVRDADETYLVFTNVSRSDALGGALSGIAHSITEGEAVRKVTDLLARAKVRLDAPNRTPAQKVEPESGLIDNARSWLVPAVAVLLIAVPLFLFFRRRQTR